MSAMKKAIEAAVAERVQAAVVNALRALRLDGELAEKGVSILTVTDESLAYLKGKAIVVDDQGKVTALAATTDTVTSGKTVGVDSRKKPQSGG